MVRLIIPVVKVNERCTWLFERLQLPMIVVRLQDFISKITYEFNSNLDAVTAAGGLHKYLNYDGVIILSLIMRDDIIANFSPDKYAAGVNALCPDLYTTIDCETYEKEYEKSEIQIERCLTQTKILIELCPEHIPLGHIKGCNFTQIKNHCEQLKSLGIRDFLFHTGDFSRHGNTNMINAARGYAEIIRQEARTLILYGLGAPSRFLEFSFADAYVTFTHFVASTHRLKFSSRRTSPSHEHYTKLTLNNFLELSERLRNANHQTKLTKGGLCIWRSEHHTS